MAGGHVRTKKGRLGMLAATRRHVFEGGGAQARMRAKSAQAPSEVVCGSTGTLVVLIRRRCGLLVRAEGLRGRSACVERRGGGSNTCRRAVAAAVLGRARSLRAVLLVALASWLSAPGSRASRCSQPDCYPALGPSIEGPGRLLASCFPASLRGALLVGAAPTEQQSGGR